MDTLRSLSGRLACRKLYSAESHAAEVVGLLLARWLLEQGGLLADRIVIPLDAHRGWFKASDESDVMGRRADLLLISFDVLRRIVKCVVVEVKLREELTSSARSALCRVMREQKLTRPRSGFVISSTQIFIQVPGRIWRYVQRVHDSSFLLACNALPDTAFWGKIAYRRIFNWWTIWTGDIPSDLVAQSRI